MRDSLRYEWVRIRTIRSTYWVTGVAVLIAVALSFLISMATSFDLRDHPANVGEIEFLAPAIVTQFAAVAGPYLVAYVLVIVGVLSWGHEYRHGMIRATLTANGSRTTVWAAKYAVLGVWSIFSVLVIMLMCTAVGWLWLQDDGVDFGSSTMVEQFGRSVGYSLLFVWVGASIASIIRNQTASLVAIFLWPLAVEPLIGLILNVIPGMDTLAKLARALPFNAGDRLMRSTDIGRALDASLGGDQLSTLTGSLIFAGFTALVMAVSYGLFLRRDA